MKDKDYVSKYLYWKMCWYEASGHLNMPMSVYDKAIMTTILLKMVGISLLWLIPLVVVVIIAHFAGGHYIFVNRIKDKDVSLHNQYNPEIQEIRRNIRK